MRMPRFLRYFEACRVSLTHSELGRVSTVKKARPANMHLLEKTNRSPRTIERTDGEYLNLKSGEELEVSPSLKQLHSEAVHLHSVIGFVTLLRVGCIRLLGAV